MFSPCFFSCYFFLRVLFCPSVNIWPGEIACILWSLIIRKLWRPCFFYACMSCVLYFSPLFLTYAFVFCAFPTVCSVTVASLYYQTWSWLMIVFLYPLVFQAGRSDKKASQGHEEKHRGWFRCVNCRVCHWSLLVHQHSWCCLAGLFRTRKTFGCPVFGGFFCGCVSAFETTWQS